MRVGVDATALTPQPTGVGNYIAPILRALATAHPESTFLLYSNDDIVVADLPNVTARVSRPKRRGPYWQNTQFARMLAEDAPDVLWAANGLVPVRRPARMGVVVTVHDLVYKFAAETIPRHSWVGRAAFQPYAIRVADRVVAVSQATADDIAAVNSRVVDAVVHPLAADRFSLAARDDVARVRAEHDLPDRYLFIAGTLEPRKNLAAFLRAYLAARTAGADLPLLAIAGRKGWQDAEIEGVVTQAEEAGLVRRLGYVDDADLPGLYAGAESFWLPSRYEGFGMPLLEAQLCGTPVLHGPHPSMAEAAGGAGVELSLDTAGLAADLTRYAAGEVPLRCRLPETVSNDADANAAVMWRLFEEAVALRRSGGKLRRADRAQRRAVPAVPAGKPVARPWAVAPKAVTELARSSPEAEPADSGPTTGPSRRPRLLILTPRYPYPVIGGDRLRIYQVCKMLAEQADLTLLSLVERPDELDMPLPDDGVFTAIERIYKQPWRSWLSTARALPTRTPLQVAYYRDARFRRRALELAATHDGILAHLVRTGDVVRDLPGPKFLEMTDAVSLNYARVRRTRDLRLRDPRTWIYSVEQPRLEDYERGIAADFDVSFLVSAVDREHLFDDDPKWRDRVLVCPNGVDLDALPYVGPGDGSDLVFIGNMASLQNLDAAHHMAADILPLVRRRVPHARLRVVGRIPADKAEELRKFPGVDVTGEVDSIPEAARGGAIAVAPLRLGAGVQNKVLEYLALGLPTVTTTVALEGLSAVPDRDLLVADAPAAFADTVVRLLGDPARGRQLAVAGREFVETHHRWEAALAPMREAVFARLPGAGD